jgi:hypothetical protein
MSLRWLSVRRVWLFAAVVLFAGCAMSFGQDSGVDLSLHAKSQATAAEIGLPMYPGATLYKPPDDKGKKDNDSSLDMGFAFGDFHFSVIVVGYETPDAPEKVLAFYRKPLSRYGEVLECDHGNAVGKLTMTNTGLTCSDKRNGHVEVNGSGDSSDDRELRAGSPHKYRIVGIDDSRDGKTHFGLVYLELPKEKNAKAE